MDLKKIGQRALIALGVAGLLWAGLGLILGETELLTPGAVAAYRQNRPSNRSDGLAPVGITLTETLTQPAEAAAGSSISPTLTATPTISATATLSPTSTGTPILTPTPSPAPTKMFFPTATATEALATSSITPPAAVPITETPSTPVAPTMTPTPPSAGVTLEQKIGLLGLLLLVLLAVLLILVRGWRRKPTPTVPLPPAPAVICPQCGHENRAGARFCLRCGEALATPPATSVEAAPPAVTAPAAPAAPPAKPAAALAGPRTAPLSATKTRPFAGGPPPLSTGAVLNQGRYKIVELRPGVENANVYLVEDTRPVHLCPSCHKEITDSKEQYCTFCGATLAKAEPLYLRYQLYESADPKAFAMEERMLRAGLKHEGLRLPLACFTEMVSNVSRRYLVEPEFAPTPATALPVPQELAVVLEWGLLLARALDYLHQHAIALGTSAGLSHIAVEGKTARWINLGTAFDVSNMDQATLGNYLAQDVRGLAAALLQLATGQPKLPTGTILPEPVMELFKRALAGNLTITTFVAELEQAQEATRHPINVTMVIGYRTDVGRQRALNEDSLLTLDLAAVYRSESVPVGLFAVADGMGGHDAGEVASQLTIQKVAQQAVNEVLRPASAGEPLPNAQQVLTAAVQAANQAVYERRKAAGTDMGNTLVAALVIGDRAVVANVGDSRGYHLTSQGITQVTVDHSLVERLVATGQITRAEALTHPQKNVIYRTIGDKPRLEADLFERRLAPGDALLLCSDGLSGMVRDEQIWQLWRTSTSPQEACDRLVEAANQAGGEDNITVVIVQISR